MPLSNLRSSRRVLSGLLFLLPVAALQAAAPQKAAPQKAESKTAESQTVDFESTLPKEFRKSIGSWEIADGVLVGREVPADHHPAASRLFFKISDGVIRGKFKLNEAKSINFGFDPAAGQLDKKGHLCSFGLTPRRVSMNWAPNKADPSSKGKMLANANVNLATDQWIDFEIRCEGETISLTAGGATLTGSHPEFSCQKTGLVLRVVGGPAMFDDIVWHIK